MHHPSSSPTIHSCGKQCQTTGTLEPVVLGLNPDFTPYWLSFWASVSLPVKMRININLKRLLGGLETVHIKHPGIWWMISKQQLFHSTFIDLGAGDPKMNKSQSTGPPSRSSQSSGKCKPRSANDSVQRGTAMANLCTKWKCTKWRDHICSVGREGARKGFTES